MISDLSTGDKLSLKGKIFELQKKLQIIDYEHRRKDEFSFTPATCSYDLNDRDSNVLHRITKADLIRKQKNDMFQESLKLQDQEACTFKPTLFKTPRKYESELNFSTPVHLRLFESARQYDQSKKQQQLYSKAYDLSSGDRLFSPKIQSMNSKHPKNKILDNSHFEIKNNSIDPEKVISVDEYLYQDAKVRDQRRRMRHLNLKTEIRQQSNISKINLTSIAFLVSKSAKQLDKIFNYFDQRQTGSMTKTDFENGCLAAEHVHHHLVDPKTAIRAEQPSMDEINAGKLSNYVNSIWKLWTDIHTLCFEESGGISASFESKYLLEEISHDFFIKICAPLLAHTSSLNASSSLQPALDALFKTIVKTRKESASNGSPHNEAENKIRTATKEELNLNVFANKRNEDFKALIFVLRYLCRNLENKSSKRNHVPTNPFPGDPTDGSHLERYDPHLEEAFLDSPDKSFAVVHIEPTASTKPNTNALSYKLAKRKQERERTLLANTIASNSRVFFREPSIISTKLLANNPIQHNLNPVEESDPTSETIALQSDPDTNPITEAEPNTRHGVEVKSDGKEAAERGDNDVVNSIDMLLRQDKIASHDLMIARGIVSEQKRSRLAQEIRQQELADCTFRPQLATKRRKPLKGGGTDREIDPAEESEAADTVLSENMQNVGTDGTIFDRLYSLKNKPMELKHLPREVEELQGCTFSPIVERKMYKSFQPVRKPSHAKVKDRLSPQPNPSEEVVDDSLEESVLRTAALTGSTATVEGFEKTTRRMLVALQSKEQIKLMEEKEREHNEEKYRKSREMSKRGFAPFHLKTELRAKEFKKKTRLIIDVRLAKGQAVKIKICDDDDPNELAARFARIYSLDAAAKDILSMIIRQSMISNNITITSQGLESSKQINSRFDDGNEAQDMASNIAEEDENVDESDDKGDDLLLNYMLNDPSQTVNYGAKQYGEVDHENVYEDDSNSHSSTNSAHQESSSANLDWLLSNHHTSMRSFGRSGDDEVDGESENDEESSNERLFAHSKTCRPVLFNATADNQNGCLSESLYILNLFHS